MPRWILLLAGCSALGATAAVPAHALDLELYAQLLETYTREVPDLAGTRVDYGALVRSEDWGRLVRSLAADQPAALQPSHETLAYWINAYNVLAIDVVVRSYPVESIRDVGSFLRPVWKRPAGTVGGRVVTLHEIEHEILRPLGDPRIHGAIVCASLSCPPLLRAPYRAERLDGQLEAIWRRWLADPWKGTRVDAPAQTLWLSRIFDWFEEDFEGTGGVLASVGRYAPGATSDWIAANPEASIRFLDYDWHLNDLSLESSDRPGTGLPTLARLGLGPNPCTWLGLAC